MQNGVFRLRRAGGDHGGHHPGRGGGAHENLVNAVQSQSYGPEARGGATRSDVIIADSRIYYPKVTQPNVLVCLTQEAYNKFYPSSGRAAL
jgi:Pyruvate/2-oxoacid:ferredoxin oxidoreductase gamma subunit